MSAADEEAEFLIAQAARLDDGAARSIAIVNGTRQAAHVAEAFARSSFAETPPGDVADAMERAGDAVAAGDLSGVERMVAAQAATLHAVFADCLARAHPQLGKNPRAAETLMRLGMKAQAQSMRAVEILGNLRAGPTIFAKQANVTTGPQQVNNHAQPSPPARPQEPAKPANELFEDARHEWMDTGTQATPSRGNQAVEALGAVNRAEDARGEGHSSSE